MATNWILTDQELPPENRPVMTKIDDGKFVRHVCILHAYPLETYVQITEGRA